MVLLLLDGCCKWQATSLFYQLTCSNHILMVGYGNTWFDMFFIPRSVLKERHYCSLMKDIFINRDISRWLRISFFIYRALYYYPYFLSKTSPNSFLAQCNIMNVIISRAQSDTYQIKCSLSGCKTDGNVIEISFEADTKLLHRIHSRFPC